MISRREQCLVVKAPRERKQHRSCLRVPHIGGGRRSVLPDKRRSGWRNQILVRADPTHCRFLNILRNPPELVGVPSQGRYSGQVLEGPKIALTFRSCSVVATGLQLSVVELRAENRRELWATGRQDASRFLIRLRSRLQRGQSGEDAGPPSLWTGFEQAGARQLDKLAECRNGRLSFTNDEDTFVSRGEKLPETVRGD